MSDHVGERSEQPGELDVHFDRLVDELTVEFADTHDESSVATVVADVRSELESQARVLDFLPVLASKHARRRLKDGLGA